MLAKPEWNEPEEPRTPMYQPAQYETLGVWIGCIAFSIVTWAFFIIPALGWLMNNAVQHNFARFAELP